VFHRLMSELATQAAAKGFVLKNSLLHLRKERIDLN
jgi:hypothetical protein